MPSLSYRFADFTFRADEETLHRAGVPVRLRIRTAQVLRVLVENHGRVIGKEEFFDKVWRGAFVEDNNLTVAVTQIRKALGETKDCAEDCKFIETVPRKGYRFVAPVEKVFEQDAPSGIERSTVIVEEAAATTGEPFITIEESSGVGAVFGDWREPSPRAQEKPDANVFARRASHKILGFGVLALTLFSIGAWWRWSASVKPVAPLRGVAVLPFIENVAWRDKGFYAEKLTQDLTYNLGRLSDVRVTSYDAVTALDAPAFDLSKLRDHLKIDAAITGKIQYDEERTSLEIAVRDLRSGASIWEKHYSFDKQDLPATYYRIARDLAPQLGDHKPFGDTPPTANGEAYRSYLDARHSSLKRSLHDREKTIEEFTAATIKDAAFADAQAGLAMAHIHHGLHLYASQGVAASRQSFLSAGERARRALQLAPGCDEALTALAFVNHRYEHDWTSAEDSFRRAVEINPNNVWARRWYGEFLHTTGRFDEGFAEQRAALALEPNSACVLNEMAWGSYLAERLDEAASYIRSSIANDKTYAAAMYNASEIYEAKGDYAAAVAAWQEAMKLEAANRKRIADVEDSFRERGRDGFVEAKIAWFESLGTTRDYIYPTDLAKSYAAIGDKDRAIEWLRRSVATRAPDALSFRYAPAFAVLRDDARFRVLIEQANFPR